MKNKPQIQWEDDQNQSDKDLFGDTPAQDRTTEEAMLAESLSETESSENMRSENMQSEDQLFQSSESRKLDSSSKDDSIDFASLLATDISDNSSEDVAFIEVGDSVSGTIDRVGASDDLLVDLGNKKVGLFTKADFETTYKRPAVSGDKIEAIVVAISGTEVTLASMTSNSVRSANDLDTAFSAGTPVKGKVVGHNKGGFEIQVMGKKAFCPISKIDLKFVDDPQKYVGRDLEFIIDKFSGRDIVVSRERLLKVKQSQIISEVTAKLEDDPDHVYDGTVTQVKDFGAFVDIGKDDVALEGLVHVSQLGFQHYRKAQEAAQIGDRVRVKILKYEDQKFSLSMKAASQDPWDQLTERMPDGSSHQGTVTRLTPFGAFVLVAPGVEGLVHISEMSWVKRIKHPSEILKEGQTISTRVLSIDLSQRRMSLSLKDPSADPWLDAKTKFQVGAEMFAKIERQKSFGAIMDLGDGVTGLLPISTIRRAFGDSYKGSVRPGLEIEVQVANLNEEERKVLLTLPSLEGDNEDQAAYQEYLAAEKARKAELANAAAQPAGNQKPGSSLGTLGEALAAKLNSKS